VALDSLLVVFADTGAAMVLCGISWAAFQSRDRPSSESFLSVLFALTAWPLFGFAEGVSQWVSVEPLAQAFQLGQLFVAILIPGLWMVYVLWYTGSGRGFTRKRLAMVASLVVPPTGAILFSLIAPSESVVEGVVVAVAGTELLLIFDIVVYSTYRFVSHGWNHPRTSKGQLVLVWVGVGAPYLASAPNETNIKALTVGFLVSSVCLAVAVDRYPLMTPLPEADYVARTRVIEALQEIVIVLDWEEHILDVNAAATEALGHSTTKMLGESVSTVAEELTQCDLSPERLRRYASS
jgi:hypothetical protein